MKIFEGGEGTYSSKINFVDDNNVLVGFDMSENCCESFGWAISQGHQGVESAMATAGSQLSDEELSNYSFDAKYFKEIDMAESWDDGGAVEFRLISEDNKEAFLILFNSHNGYYCHGFEMTKGDDKIQDGVI